MTPKLEVYVFVFFIITYNNYVQTLSPLHVSVGCLATPP